MSHTFNWHNESIFLPLSLWGKMTDFSEFINEFAEALLEKDEALYRVVMCKSFEINLALKEKKALIESCYDRAVELGGNIDEINDWVVSVSSIFSARERKEVLSQGKMIFTEELLNHGMNLGFDFELTPNGSIRVLSQRAWNILKEKNDTGLLEYAIYFKVLRISKQNSTIFTNT